jgi:hypothetical protein
MYVDKSGEYDLEGIPKSRRYMIPASPPTRYALATMGPAFVIEDEQLVRRHDYGFDFSPDAQKYLFAHRQLVEIQVEINAVLRNLARTNPVQAIVRRSLLTHLADLQRRKKELEEHFKL